MDGILAFPRPDLLDRIRILRDSLIDTDIVVDDLRRVAADPLEIEQAIGWRDDVAQQLAAAIAESRA